MIPKYTVLSQEIFSAGEAFWERADLTVDSHDLLKFSFFFGFFPFAGYLFYYTVSGHVWNEWPFINTTLPVLRGAMCAGLQWIFFAMFPTVSALILDFVFRGKFGDPRALAVVCTYSMVPVYVAALFVGVLFLNEGIIMLGLSAFVYLLFFGHRKFVHLSLSKSILLTVLVVVVFALIRQMIVFVIGF